MTAPERTFEDMMDRLFGFRKLKKDWDSYKAPPISQHAIHCAAMLMQTTVEIGMPVPWPCPRSDGGVSLSWGDDEQVDISFLEDGTAVVEFSNDPREGDA